MKKNNRLFNSNTFIKDNKNFFLKALNQESLYKLRGTVLESTSLLIRASVPLVSLGEVCSIILNNNSPLLAQVVGFREKDVFLMPLGNTDGLSPNCQVIPSGKPFTIKVGYPLLGRVLNGLGKPMDGKTDLDYLDNLYEWSLYREAPDPYKRKPVNEALSLGIRAIDGLLTIGKGQRIGLFAGSGVGKSSLLGKMVRNSESKIVVACLLGERGREVMEFIENNLRKEGQQKTVMIVATSDSPSLVRYLSAYVATSIAEWFRDQGEDVLFLMDSATRFARALREIGLALGEPPARQGYPPSVFAELPKLLERTGTNHLGSITALYSILVQGSDMEEPIADEMRGILDGHIILNRSLAEKNHWPAIDILPSLSRVMSHIIDEKHKNAANNIRNLLSIYEKNKDLILLGAYKNGTDPLVDLAIKKMPYINNFLQQNDEDKTNYYATRENLVNLSM